MNWTPASNPARAGPGMIVMPTAGFGKENGRPKMSRTLSDITNNSNRTLGIQGGIKAPLLEPKTPARRSSQFAVFEDGAEEMPSAVRHPASPPQLRPKSRGSDQDCFLGDGGQMLDIEEVLEAELPPIQDFAGRVSDQDQYWQAFGCDDDPDGFGRPEDLARMLGEGTARAQFEAEDASAMWDMDLEGSGTASSALPGIHELNVMAWPSLSPSPKRELLGTGLGAFGLSSSPLFSPMDMEMDIDSGSEEGQDGCGSAEVSRHAPSGHLMAF